MNLCISKEGCIKNNTTVDKAIVLFAVANKVNYDDIIDQLLKEGLITNHYNSLYKPDGLVLTHTGAELLDAIVTDSDKIQNPDELLEELATSLKVIFPQGKKEGTNYYWTEGIALIKRRLKLFFKKYGNSYTNEQIIQAAKKYVESFNGNYMYMKLLKYFIFKEKVNANEVEGESELLNYIENAGQENELSTDWAIEIR